MTMFEGGCGRCGPDVPAVVVVDGEALCDFCFDDMLGELRDCGETAVAELMGQLSFDEMGEPDVGIPVEDIRSPLLCGDDE